MGKSVHQPLLLKMHLQLMAVKYRVNIVHMDISTIIMLVY